MVALNYQSHDRAMSHQRALFRDNGGCGYLLKPACLLSDARLFDPKQRLWNVRKHIEIVLISGQHLPKESNSLDDTDIVDPYVRVNTYGIACDHSEHRTPSIRNNGLNPRWNYRFRLNIACSQLCLIRFQVRDDDRYGRSTFLGQACLPVDLLQSGYRHVKLQNKTGDFIHGTLFVHIRIEHS
jgi:hypothetical protein